MIKGHKTEDSDGSLQETLFTIEKEATGLYYMRKYHVVPESDLIELQGEAAIGYSEVTSIDVDE